MLVLAALTLVGSWILAGIFMPDDPSSWPGVDSTHPRFLADLKVLERRLGH